MGDVLHALPAVAALRAMRPDLPIDWVVDPRWAPLLLDDGNRSSLISRVHLAETRMWSGSPFSARTVNSVLTLRRALREQEYSHVVDMQGTLRSAVIGSFAGARSFFGFADPRETAARWLYTQRAVRRGTHVVEQGAALLSDALGVALQPALVPLPRQAPAEVWADELLQKFEQGTRVVLLAPTAGWGGKQWPAERFGALATALHARGCAVLVNCARGDDPVAAAVVKASGGAAEAVPCGIAELIALTRRTALVVGGDTGPVHLAAALGTPIVALYGPTDPARNGPWGPGLVRVLRDALSVTSYKRSEATEAGLARLTVPEVLQATLEVGGDNLSS